MSFKLYDRSKDKPVKARPVKGANQELACKIAYAASIKHKKVLKELSKV